MKAKSLKEIEKFFKKHKKILEELEKNTPKEIPNKFQCQAHISEKTDYGRPFLRNCKRNGKYKRYGKLYCKQHAKKIRKPIIYG